MLIGYIKIENKSNQFNGNRTAITFIGQEQISKKINSVLSEKLDKIMHPDPGITLAAGLNFG